MDSEDMRAALRARHEVRVVEPKEEGFAARDLPQGVYGFTASAGLAAPLFAVRRYRNFEVHHLRDGDIAIIGFVTPKEVEQLRAAPHQPHLTDPAHLTLYPDVKATRAKSSRSPTRASLSIVNTPFAAQQVSSFTF